MIQPGQEVMALPSRQRTTIKEIWRHDKALDHAVPGQSIVLTTVDHIDLSRGDMLVPVDAAPQASTNITACLVWLSHAPLHKDTRYLVKHTTKVLVGKISRLNHKIEINSFAKLEAESLEFNEIGEVDEISIAPSTAIHTSRTGAQAASLLSIRSTTILSPPG